MTASSPFAAQLGTNYCPKDDEIAEIKSLLVEPTRRLKQLDDKIADLQKAIDKLAEERHRLGSYVGGHEALISPVRRLPLDILQEIFIACIPTHRNCVMSAAEAPVLLGRICSSWRTISLATPRLWCRLHIVEPPRLYGSSPTLVDRKIAQRLEITKMWLRRSGQCPLSLSLKSGPEYDSPPTTPTIRPSRGGKFLQALIPYAARWQHIHFTTPTAVLQEMAHLTEADVPLLESVGIYPQHQFPLHEVNWGLFRMLGSERMTGFSVAGNSFAPEVLPLRWERLTVLQIEGPVWESSMSSEAILRTVARCPALRRCKLVVNDSITAMMAELTLSPVELPSLRKLELDFGSVATTVTRLLNCLALPDLRAFSLHGHADLTNSQSLARFLALATRLETLELDTNTFSKASLLDSLRALPPTVRKLTIHDISHRPEVPLTPSLDDDALALLASDVDAPLPCCPALEALHLHSCCLVSDAALLRFLTVRLAGRTPTLKRVEVQFNREETTDLTHSRLLAFTLLHDDVDVEVAYLPPHTSQFSPWQGLADAPYHWGPPQGGGYW
ncbi:hypothetical protein C8R46DRAFT_1104087 [Mycena filopes]|nr:hypothetical protein C8R46DRAFT_1104087 [Mycena filopes]